MPKATVNLDQNSILARAKGRSIGTLFFSAFGGLWLAVSLYAFGLLTHMAELIVAFLTFAFIGAAVWLLRAIPRGVKPDPQREHDGRMFGLVNAAQGLALFLTFMVANHLHHPNAAFPVAVLIVGLHFFAMPRSYRLLSNLVTGAALVLAAALCPVLFQGDAMVGAVTFCAGLILWGSATWALRTAFVLLRAS